MRTGRTKASLVRMSSGPRALGALIALALCANGLALAQSPAPAPAPAIGAGSPLESAASHIAILDQATGLVLHCKACEMAMPPASMSKLMTVLLIAERMDKGLLKPDTLLPVSERAWRLGAQSDGSHMFLELNSQVRVDDLLKGVVVVSANDACIVLAEGAAGSEEAFVAEMNARAKELGLSSAQFRNVTGLPDPGHVISALDLAKLARFIVQSQPDLYALYAIRELTYNAHTQQNRNPLLGLFPGADGLKTGHTNISGYGLVGSAVENGKRRIIVFNGMPSMAARRLEAQRLMRAAFADFSATALYAKGAAVGEAPVFLGARPSVKLIAAEDINVGFARAARPAMHATIVFRGPIKAPIKAGAHIADLVVEGPGHNPQRFALHAEKAVGRADVFTRAIAGLRKLTGPGA